MNYLVKYQKIVDGFVRKDFPALKNKNILIREKKANYRATVDYLPWPIGMRITLSEKLRRLPEKSVRRIIFHELCHLEIFLSWGVLRTNLNFITYILSKKVRKQTEAQANILMIKKGHYREVLAARQGNLRRGLDYSLTKEEIMDYVKRYKK